MKKFYIAATKRGQPPGAAIYTGKKTEVPIRIQVVQYTKDQLDEHEFDAVEDCLPYADGPAVSWVNIDGLNHAGSIEKVGRHLGLHPLIIEDILHPHQRPKIEDSETTVFMVLRMLRVDSATGEISSEQISFVLNESGLFSFQESAGDVFDGVRERLRKMKGCVRRKGADYLLYSLVDAIIDHYFTVLEHLGERIERVELALMSDPQPTLLNEIYAMKRELLYIRKSVWPLRECIGKLERAENPLFHEETQAYVRDLYDHTIQVIDTVESFRDMLSSVQDLYLSCLGNKTNQVMKVLTIIATIFIPITFIAGIYGMNFEGMPELNWRYGYMAVWGVMLLMVAGMLLLFRAKKWF